jgi:hypothetical protein
MNWKHLLFLAVGFAAGLAVGLSRSPSPETRAPARPITTTEKVPAAAREEQVPDDAPQQDRAVEAKEATQSESPPIGPQEMAPAELDVSEGYGIVEVDFNGVDCDPEFNVDVRGLSGEWDELESSTEKDRRIARLELPPGTHLPHWKVPGRLRRCGVSVRVEAGRVTRVHAADSSNVIALPVRSGFARLEVIVRGLDGAPLPGARILVEGATSAGPDSVDGRTDKLGRWQLELLPGARTVVVGARRVPVQLIEGQISRIEIEPAGQGMLLFEPLGLGSAVWVTPLDSDVEWQDSRIRFTEGGKTRYGAAYLAPGEYRLSCGGYHSGARILGRASIRRGQTTRVQLARGSITCLAFVSEAHRGALRQQVLGYAARVSTSSRKVETRIRALSSHGLNYRAEEGYYALLNTPYLPSGRYRVWAESGKFRSEKRIVDVGEDNADVRLTLLPVGN